MEKIFSFLHFHLKSGFFLFVYFLSMFYILFINHFWFIISSFLDHFWLVFVQNCKLWLNIEIKSTKISFFISFFTAISDQRLHCIKIRYWIQNELLPDVIYALLKSMQKVKKWTFVGFFCSYCLVSYCIQIYSWKSVSSTSSPLFTHLRKMAGKSENVENWFFKTEARDSFPVPFIFCRGK